LEKAMREALIPKIYPKFWLKTALHRLTPGGWGYHRRLKASADPNYVHERDKHPVRHKHHGAGGWKEADETGLQRRDYADYDEYLTHQKLKIEEMLKMKGGFSNEDLMNYRLRFYLRFRHLPPLLPRDARILCMGARQGTEVEVLRDLGFANATGIDLNPGPDNPLVKPGDFMKLDFPDSSLDLLYTNCVDHAFDLDAFFAEHARAMKPDGYVLYDLAANMEEGGGAFEAVAWRRTEDIFEKLLRRFKKLIHVEREPQWMWVLLQGK
jgi:SAM-dependent methyltransferase